MIKQLSIETKSEKEIRAELADNFKRGVNKNVCPYRVVLLNEEGDIVKNEYNQPIKKETWDLTVTEILCLCNKNNFSILNYICEEQKVNDSWCKLKELTDFIFKTKKGAELGGPNVYNKFLKKLNGTPLLKMAPEIQSFWEYMTEEKHTLGEVIDVKARQESLEDSLKKDPITTK